MMVTKLKSFLLNLEQQGKYTKKLMVELMARRNV
jgi:hypothetical protein